MARARKLMEITIKKNADDTFTSKYMLPMSNATEEDSFRCANSLRELANAQLQFSGSSKRLVLYDIETKEFLTVVRND